MEMTKQNKIQNFDGMVSDKYLAQLVSRGEVARAELQSSSERLNAAKRLLHKIDIVQVQNLLSSMENSILESNHTALRTFIANFLERHLYEIIRLRLASKFLDVDELSRGIESIEVLIATLKIPEPEYANKSREEVGLLLGQAGLIVQDFLIKFAFDYEFEGEIRAAMNRFMEYSKNDIAYDQEF